MTVDVPVIESAAELRSYVGRAFGPTSWQTVTQERIDAFADATGDHSWIHVDPERAASGEFGTTIAHGHLTLSLYPLFLPELFKINFGRRMNYGSDRVRFPEPVRCGSRIRARAVLAEVVDRQNGLVVRTDVVIEIEGYERPACVAQTLRFIGEPFESR